MAFDDPGLAQSLGVVALRGILFVGGLDKHWSDVRSVLCPAGILSALGVVLAVRLVEWFTAVRLGFSVS